MAIAQALIAKSLRIKGDVSANELVIEGEVEGRISASRVELRSSAKVQGEISAPSVIIEEGASFVGSVRMDVGIPEDI
jgi:cytoskeletal protein CcmA (bactofilin family)